MTDALPLASETAADPVVIVDDEPDMRESVSQWLTLSGFAPMAFGGAEDALRALGADFPGVVITDIRMPGMDGMALLKRLTALDSSLPVILITGHGDVPMAVEAMRLGAFDFVEKPFDPDHLIALVRKALRARSQTLEARALRHELASGDSLMRRLVGNSPEMVRLREDILDYGQAEGHVLIDGETGTGKTLVAHALHAVGPHAARRFVSVSCLGADDAELAAQVFGPLEAGIPLVDEARGGTLCLEDIEAIGPQMQARLLAYFNGTPQARVIALCNDHEPGRTLEDILRPDLFFRLATIKLTLPPLRARGEDILALFATYAAQYADEYGCATPELSAPDAAALLQAPWPGNVRQLISIAEAAVLQSRRGAASVVSLVMAGNESEGAALTTEGKPLKDYVDAFERTMIDNCMRRHKGSIAAVMEELCLPRRTLNEKMAKYGLQRGDYV
jgi:DNA-binding NtrC family response regulator